jgi:ribosomal protein S18 acetylase RimI-like enzyme
MVGEVVGIAVLEWRATANNRWKSETESVTLETVDARLYDDVTDFGPVAHCVYRRNPVLFTIELTALRTPRWPADQVLLSIADGDDVGAALQMGGGTLLVSGLPPASAKEAAAALVPVRADLPAVRGTPSAAASFSQAWAEVSGVCAMSSFRETLYRLDELSPPGGVVGVARLAGDADDELLVGWLDAFFVDAFGAPSDPSASREALRSFAEAAGHMVLWTVNGAPVSMARVQAPAVGMSRIGPVYTPPECRGNGYGAAVTAAAVRQAVHRGARDVVLFADVANPVSNRLYRRLGFVPVVENVQYSFAAAT